MSSRSRPPGGAHADHLFHALVENGSDAIALVDAMGESGMIDARVDTIELDERSAVRYPGVPAGPYARLVVHDTGVGIDHDVERHVFEPFFTTKGPSKGPGLGLSIVYTIAKEAGGIVTFLTARNRGTTFEVLLPLIERL